MIMFSSSQRLFVTAIVASLYGCAGLEPASGTARVSIKMFSTATATANARPEILRPLADLIPELRTPKGDLVVADDGYNAVNVLKYWTWSVVRTISTGIDSPNGAWVDTRENLYVANDKSYDITEYNSQGSLTATYSSGMSFPTAVTTDRAGNVYEADYGGQIVNEYRQSVNTVVASCAPGGEPQGVAVDHAGDVFVAYFVNSHGTIKEYPSGLRGCKGTTLGAQVTFPGGMVLDRRKNLLLCDMLNGSVDLIAPPYSQVTRHLGSGFTWPYHVTINAANSLAYVTDQDTHEVYVITYPQGKQLAALGSDQNVEQPTTAVNTSNYVP